MFTKSTFAASIKDAVENGNLEGSTPLNGPALRTPDSIIAFLLASLGSSLDEIEDSESKAEQEDENRGFHGDGMVLAADLRRRAEVV